MRRALPLLIILVLLLVAGTIYLLREPDKPTPIPPPRPGPSLSELATPPDWSLLDPLQGTLDRETFRMDLMKTYALPGAWEATMTFGDDQLDIRRELRNPNGIYNLSFADSSPPLQPLPPLQDLHIAIDPGHIGGAFAEMEARNFDPTPDDPSDIPVREGDLTLATAKYLKPLLESLGARVTLVRETSEPVTTQRPEDFFPNHPDRVLAERIFYRTAEIRARAEKVNNEIKPDLVLALHYNADAWNGENPWAARNHFHIIMHGAYMPEELAMDDQRFEMTRHILTRTTARALPLARTLSDTFIRLTGLIPFNYNPNAPAILVDPVRPIYARNLLANRLYQCPTIYLEPYVMNNKEVFERVQLGDYEGTRMVNGVERISLIREYAVTVFEAFRQHDFNQTITEESP